MQEIRAVTKFRRKGTPRSRNGCLTCKIRRVKCDERRPYCSGCMNTGRLCEGYPEATNTYNTLTFVPQVLSGPATNLDSNEASHLNLFRHILVDQIFRDADFPTWKSDILQMVHQEAAVRHAAIALTAVARNRNQPPDGLPKSAEIFSIKQYARSIQALKKALQDASKKDIEAALACAVLNICYDILEGEHVMAKIHLDNALRLCRSRNIVVEACIANILLRLDVQASTYMGQHIPDAVLPVAQDSSSPFKNHRVASNELYQLLSQVWSFLRSAAVQDRYIDRKPVAEALRVSGRSLCTALVVWKAKFDLLFNNTALFDMQYHRSAASQQIQYNVAVVSLVTCLDPIESLYDSCDAQFQQILALSKTLSEDSISPDIFPRFSLHLGIVQPLYMTALKCRIPNIRRDALRLLRSQKTQEGVWNSSAAAAIAAEVIRIEEAGLCEAILSSQRIPEANRVHSVDTSIDPRTSQAKFTCRLLPNGFTGDWCDLECFTTW